MKHKILTQRLLAILLLILATPAFGQTLTITAPAESLTGDLVVLTASGQQADCNYAWTVIPPELVEGKALVCDNGRTIVFASRLPGTYYFTLAGVIDGKPVTVTHRLDNITPEAKPIPLPPVEPDDTPPLPVINVDAEIAALRQLAPRKATELVKSQYFDREKKALAESFLTTAKWIESSSVCNAISKDCEVITPEQARVKQRDNARRYLSSVTRNSWQSWEAWDNAISKQLADLDAGKPLTVEQIGQAYKQIGLGLQ